MRNIVGTPPRGEDFFDREELIATIWEQVEGANNMLLAAPRRFGNTSVMYRLIDRPKPGWKCVHVDAESIREPANFIIALLDALMKDESLRIFLKTVIGGLGKWFKDLFSEINLDSKFLDISLKIKLKDRLKDQWEEVGWKMLTRLRELQDGTKLLFIIDELPVMLGLFKDNGVTDEETRAFLYWFRKLRQDPDFGLLNCRFLIGGSIGIEGHLSRIGAVDSIDDFQKVVVGELTPSLGMELLTRLFKGRRLEVEDQVKDKMLEILGAPVPFFIQVFFNAVIMDRLYRKRPLDINVVQEVYESRVLGTECKTYFQHYYDRLRLYTQRDEAAAKQILKKIALEYPNPVPQRNLKSAFSKAIGTGGKDDDSFSGLMATLENDFYVRYEPEKKGYSFALKVLCDWWRRYYAF